MANWLLPALAGAVALALVALIVLMMRRRKAPPAQNGKVAALAGPLDRSGMLQAAFDRATLGIGFVNADWQWLEVNRKLLSSLGYGKTEMGNLPLRFLTHPEDRKREAPLFAELRAGKRAGYTMTKRLLRKSGDYRSVRVQMLRFAETPQVLFQCTVDDSPGHLSQVETLSAALAEVEESAAVLCDTSGIITGWNKGAERLFGYSAEEVLGSGWTRLHEGESRESLTRMVAAAAQNGFTRALNRRRKSDGSTVVVRSVLIADLLRGEASGFLEICHAASGARVDDSRPEIIWTTITGDQLAETLSRVADEAGSGTLHVRSTNGDKRFLFEHGQLVACTSDRDERLLGQLLVDAGVIGEDTRRAALDAQRTSGDSFGNSVVDVSGVTEDDIAETIRAKAKREIADAASWPRAEWSFGEGARPAMETIPVAIDMRGLLAELTPPARLIGRKNAKKRLYHATDCSAAASIPRQHSVTFDTPEDAEDQGYRPCSRCLTTSAESVFADSAAVF